MTNSLAVRILILGNGAAGAEKQAIALGRRLHRQLGAHGAECRDGPELVRVPLQSHPLVQRLPPALQIVASRLTRDPFFGYDVHADEVKRVLVGPRETKDRDHRSTKIVIGCGRTTVALCASSRWWARSPTERVFSVQIQHPRVPLGLFDAVITPRHDVPVHRRPFLPANVYLTQGTFCEIDRSLLDTEGQRWRGRLGSMLSGKAHCIVWLIGGPCRGFEFDEATALEMTRDILYAMDRSRGNAVLMVTFSRRTPPAIRQLIAQQLRVLKQDELYIWDGEGDNPYHALLQFASAIVTTPDSISMTTEALATGKPVFTVGSDRIRGKFRRFHEDLRREGYVDTLANGSWDEASALKNTTTHPSAQRARTALEEELESIAGRIASKILSS